jgi:hypothetical protein
MSTYKYIQRFEELVDGVYPSYEETHLLRQFCDRLWDHGMTRTIAQEQPTLERVYEIMLWDAQYQQQLTFNYEPQRRLF